MAGPVDDTLAELLALPPDRFVAARNAAASERAKAGDRAGAARLKAIRRPGPAVWLANALAREAPGETDALVRAGARLRELQSRAAFGDETHGLREALSAFRSAVADALARAAQIGRPTPAAQARLASLLHAAASGTEDEREALRTGTLTAEVEGATFGSIQAPRAEVSPDRDARARTARDERARAERERERAIESRRRELEHRLREQERLEREAAGLEREAQRARETAQRLDERAAELRAQARQAGARAADVRAELGSLGPPPAPDGADRRA